TTLCALTAAALIALSLGITFVRCQVLGAEARVPVGANTWKVTMVVQGQSLGDAKLQTATPLDIDRQHVLRETWRSSTFLDKPPTATPGRAMDATSGHGRRAFPGAIRVLLHDRSAPGNAFHVAIARAALRAAGARKVSGSRELRSRRQPAHL